jgi:hypothetical protein
MFAYCQHRDAYIDIVTVRLHPQRDNVESFCRWLRAADEH